ncbi:MAG: hypothetical protein LBD23_05210 [Oscillospiraceae bacterium]|nr:hypothetical protein [Oscillospiraceae bacterium]
MLKLTAAEKTAYNKIKAGFENYATSIDISGVDKNIDIMNVFKAVIHDHPQFIYFNNSQIGTVNSFFGQSIKLSGCINKSKALKMLNECYAAAYPIIETARQKKDAYQQLITIYEYLQSRIIYDKDELHAVSKNRAGNQLSHNMYGALVVQKAVCDGFSAAFQYVASHLGYRSTVINGKSDHCSFGNVNHAWNMIEIAGNYYHLDLTWDSCHFAEHNEYSYSWFLHDDEGILADHTWDVNTTYAATDATLSFYNQNGLFVTCERDIIAVIKKGISNSGNLVRLRCSENVWNAKPMDEYLVDLVLNTAVNYLNRSIQITYHWNEKTRCFSAKIF